MFRYTCILVLLFTSLCSCDGSGQNGGSGGAIDLKMNLQKGAVYRYTIKNHQVNTHELKGRNLSNELNIETDLEYSVTGADATHTSLSASYEKISVEPSYTSQLSTMLHKPFHITLDDKGRIMAIESYKQFSADSVVDETQLLDSALHSMIQQAFNIYPGRPVKPGDSWTNGYTVSLGFMDLSSRNTYRLTSVKDGIAHIETTSRISSKQGINDVMRRMKIELEGVQTGGLDVDVATGLVMGNVQNLQVTGSNYVNGEQVAMHIDAEISVIGNKLK
ncbi:MAG: hypothetical protein JSS82_10015 [Bacteroidetes bacterium]|nr:hypothetical protein [Bacteroidota bacterium]